jgi:hypothetical protein
MRAKGGKETFPPLDPPISGAPDGQQSLPVLRTQASASVSLLSGVHLTSASPLPGGTPLR